MKKTTDDHPVNPFVAVLHTDDMTVVVCEIGHGEITPGRCRHSLDTNLRNVIVRLPVERNVANVFT